MKFFSISILFLLTCCNTLVKHKDDFKVIGHDMVDEGIDDVAEEFQSEPVKQ